MKALLTEPQEREVDRVMGLAMDWLTAWDVTGEMENPEPEKARIAAMHRLKEAVVGLVCDAMPANAGIHSAAEGRPVE